MLDYLIVGLKCYDLLAGAKTPRYLGGIERQLVTLANCLTESGARVGVATYAEPNGKGMSDLGVHIYPLFEPAEGVRFLRSVYPRYWRLRNLVKKTKPRVVIQMGCGFETALAARASSAADCRFTYLVASDIDTDPSLLARYPLLDRLGYRYGLVKADIVLAQTPSQKARIRDNFRRDSDLYKLPYVPPECEVFNTNADYEILWIGRIVPEKRPEWLLEIAQLHPELKFAVIGAANTPTDYANSITAGLSSMPNIDVLGKLSDGEIQTLYKNCQLLLCTSDVEGFPTTFLEAWYHRKPVVSSFDPGGLVTKNGLGSVASDWEGLSKELGSMLTKSKYSTTCQSISMFFETEFSKEAVMPHLYKLLG